MIYCQFALYCHLKSLLCGRYCTGLLMPQGILSHHKLRQEAASCKRWNPDWSYSKIAKHLGCSHSFVSRWVGRNRAYGHVDDKPRSGRPAKADAAAHKQLVMAAQHPECKIAADTAAKAERDHQQHFSTCLHRPGPSYQPKTW